MWSKTRNRLGAEKAKKLAVTYRALRKEKEPCSSTARQGPAAAAAPGPDPVDLTVDSDSDVDAEVSAILNGSSSD